MPGHPRYADRRAAGDALADLLAGYAGRPDLLVLALPRGGVPVAARIADRLGAPLDVLLVRKVGLPRQPELAMGAVASIAGRTEQVRNEAVLADARIPDEQFRNACAHQLIELRRREAAYRGDRPPVDPAGRTVIVVDDGLATGATMRAALAVLAPAGPARSVLAVPIAPGRTCRELARLVDEVVCPWQPADFGSVSQGYLSFGQTGDDEVRDFLAEQH